MHAALERIPVLAAALWWGSLSAVGFMVVPMLFAHLASPAIAGAMAAKLFAAQTWVSVVCAMVLLLATRRRSHSPMARRTMALAGWVLAGLALALLVEFGVAPQIVGRSQLRLWHSVGSIAYALQWVCAAVVLWCLAAPAASAASAQGGGVHSRQ